MRTGEIEIGFREELVEAPSVILFHDLNGEFLPLGFLVVILLCDNISQGRSLIEISTKSQAPNNKQIPMAQIRNFKEICFGHLKLGLGAYLGFEICNLEFRKGHFHIILSF
jgi:hypothetical protein